MSKARMQSRSYMVSPTQYGRESNGSAVSRGLAPPAKTTHTTHVPSSITAGQEGVVLIHLEVLSDHLQGPYSKMSDVSSLNILPNTPNVDPGARRLSLPFVKVDTLPRANSGCMSSIQSRALYVPN